MGACIHLHDGRSLTAPELHTSVLDEPAEYYNHPDFKALLD